MYIPQLAVVHNQCTTLVNCQNMHTIPSGVHCQQLWNAIIIAVIVLYFRICNVFLDLTWYLCNHNNYCVTDTV